MARKGTCIFCGRAGKLTIEHVVPAWLEVVAESIGEHDAQHTQHEAFVGTDIYYRKIPHPSVTARCVCRRCNEGWMSSLEGRVKPLIDAMVTRPGRVHLLDREDQAALALWMAKTTLTFERVNDPDVRVAPADDFAHVYSERTPPPGSRVVLARYDDDPAKIAHLGIFAMALIDGRPGSVYGATLRCGPLLVHYVRPLMGQVIPLDTPALRRSLTPVWPVTCDVVSWPPDQSMWAVAYDALARASMHGGIVDAPQTIRMPVVYHGPRQPARPETIMGHRPVSGDEVADRDDEPAGRD